MLIQINTHHIYHADGKLNQRIDEILRILQDIRRKEVIEMADLKILKEKVIKIETVGDSMKETMIGIAAALEAAKTDPVAIQAIADELSMKADEWAAAVVASTPAAP
jgi:aspartokinase